jgi:hypothetical protein
MGSDPKTPTRVSIRREEAEALFRAQAMVVLVGLGLVGRLRRVLRLEEIVGGLGHRASLAP